MQEDIGVVMSRGIQVEEFKIQRMRKPSYGMPVASVVSGKSPSYGSPSQSGAHVRVLEDVLVVVVIDKIVTRDRVVDQQRNDGQHEAKDEP
ncbi:MAG: hypothetical protein DMG68_19240 [Acidobacteria bacterium]|nr:MAG: hypothetical protein DMG68_19240 [Acidobacteriota bacterium]